mmetsp:Transcript_5721/g.10729  ORF Transcript_5721/g.10729 Transcript_5721/m.10729 type:complete len:299 (-) Transcript_5721:1352-2248(-)
MPVPIGAGAVMAGIIIAESRPGIIPADGGALAGTAKMSASRSPPPGTAPPPADGAPIPMMSTAGDDDAAAGAPKPAMPPPKMSSRSSRSPPPCAATGVDKDGEASSPLSPGIAAPRCASFAASPFPSANSSPFPSALSRARLAFNFSSSMGGMRSSAVGRRLAHSSPTSKVANSTERCCSSMSRDSLYCAKWSITFADTAAASADPLTRWLSLAKVVSTRDLVALVDVWFFFTLSSSAHTSGPDRAGNPGESWSSGAGGQGAKRRLPYSPMHHTPTCTSWSCARSSERSEKSLCTVYA